MESQQAKPAKPAKKDEKISNVRGIRSAFLVILACAVVAVCVFMFVMGDAANFEGNDPVNGHPINLLGTIYKGGFIVPILQTLFLTVIVLSVERWIALSSAQGKGNTSKFVAEIKKLLSENKIDAAMELCKKQRGSVASVVYNTLVKYKEMDANTVLSKEQKLTTLRNEVEEATALEMPALSQNLPIVATLTTLGTLVGLLGTVMGMIKSFQALATSGSPDSTALSTGISEALINTAFGIATGAFAVISYNFYTNKIDNLTYAIDEIGFSIVATFAATH
ncbi:MAG: MotA/TolQ/ExbB proton channel family protein [Muribaculaceae bacterium]|jgi:biopolymer transport protein ExbB|nr:MotA/TolQ/ExbB proton channel family protein [Muribaculaceae bacterium]MBQ1185656.1 MotA/TolQ/ExbB proton channel family protein [Muribaculaceae bacterium]MBQ2370651.1 MotA/TolQ/ExbB proton channel family protein [Muribaculaceae bacterium]MBQ2399164.1 MotA/TolQ/ExbB proton channel family protein [Muribaculaceae bacterium]MBQ5696772.1 MotA/TolQ/ExbB proton channel family protein [Muribaculaceae bacterium]